MNNYRFMATTAPVTTRSPEEVAARKKEISKIIEKAAVDFIVNANRVNNPDSPFRSKNFYFYVKENGVFFSFFHPSILGKHMRTTPVLSLDAEDLGYAVEYLRENPEFKKLPTTNARESLFVCA